MLFRSFPIWIFVNQTKNYQFSESNPCFVLMLGGSMTNNSETPIPATLPIFSSESLASASLSNQLPFSMKMIDRASFYKIIEDNPTLEDVVLDYGNPHAAVFRVESLIAERDSSTHS